MFHVVRGILSINSSKRTYSMVLILEMNQVAWNKLQLLLILLLFGMDIYAIVVQYSLACFFSKFCLADLFRIQMSKQICDCPIFFYIPCFIHLFPIGSSILKKNVALK